LKSKMDGIEEFEIWIWEELKDEHE
jgi:hypothetical protein